MSIGNFNRMTGGGGGKQVYYLVSRCSCRVMSYLNVTLSPSRTVMLSGTCPNSAPCKLAPVKKKKKKNETHE